jgi:hypothetical protein
MDTIFIICDSVVTSLTLSADASQIIIKEAETSGWDICIVAIICLTLLIFASNVKDGLIEWQKEKLAIQKELDDKKRMHELELKQKEAELKENAETNEHFRKVFNQVLDSVLKDKDQQSPTFTECVSKKIEDIKKKIEKYLQEMCNEKK